jgi:hypothetical protein
MMAGVEEKGLVAGGMLFATDVSTLLFFAGAVKGEAVGTARSVVFGTSADAGGAKTSPP